MRSWWALTHAGRRGGSGVPKSQRLAGGMREFICDECRDAQIAALGGIETQATAWTAPVLAHDKRSAGTGP